ncbi:MAG: EAL domain-containing protein [Candidatus Omnitrophota bacterium]
MTKKKKGYITEVADDIHHMFSIGPVIFIKWSCQKDWVVEYISPNISQLGYSQDEFMDQKVALSDIIHAKDNLKFAEGLKEIISTPTESFQGVIRLLTADGEFHRLYHYTVSALNLKQPKNCYYGYFIELRDYRISRTHDKAKIEHRAYHDMLTGLPNRFLFNDRLALEINRASRNKENFAVMFLDLDDFKRINDSLGHLKGDLVLQETASRLQNCIRNEDTLARIGGDEFTVLLPQIPDPKEIVAVLQRILNVFKYPFYIEELELYTTTSIGISIFPADGKDPVELMKNADMAMYHAKEQGKNNYVFYSEEMNSTIKKRVEMENQLWRGLRKKEFVLHYQPIVNLKTGYMEGVEALVRWNNPQTGLMYPVDFISLASETGMILQLEQWVLKTSCRQNLEWKLLGLDGLYVSINISSQQFMRSDFLKCVQRLLSDTRQDPCDLAIQLTESGLIDTATRDKMVRILKILRRIGIRLSIDNFGVGFTSLHYLKSFTVDILEIDRSFMKGVPHDPEFTAIASSIITLGKNLNIQVLAEGVETKEQLDFLVANDCDLLQGYYFSPPVPPDHITQMMKEKKNIFSRCV